MRKKPLAPRITGVEDVLWNEDCLAEIERARRAGFLEQQSGSEHTPEVRRRALVDDAARATEVWARVAHHVPRLDEIYDSALRPDPPVAEPLTARDPTALNERLVYYLYEPGGALPAPRRHRTRAELDRAHVPDGDPLPQQRLPRWGDEVRRSRRRAALSSCARGGMKTVRLLDDDEIERSSVVANASMNRERGLTGTDGYEKDRRLNPVDWLVERLTTKHKLAWLDLCCGSGKALVEGARLLRERRVDERVTTIGVDPVPMFVDVPAELDFLRLVAGSILRWQPRRHFDLVTCVHGLHYIGDSSWRSLAHLPGSRPTGSSSRTSMSRA